MTKEDEQVVEDFVELLNEQGRSIAEYLDELLSKDENEEAAAWLTIEL